MPSTSPGLADTPTAFAEILPGSPAGSLQATATFIYHFKRYIAYISGRQLNVLSAPNVLIQAITFKHDLTAIAADPKSGKLIVTGKQQAWILDPVAEGWTKMSWEKALLLKQDDGEVDIHSVCWSNEGEALLGGSRFLTLFSTQPTSRSSSPRTSAIDGETVEERSPLWSRPVARPIQQASFDPSSTLIATRARYDRLVKIWRRLSFEEGLFDHMYLPHPAAVTHIEWRPLDEHADIRRGSAISRRHEEEQEVLYTIATDGVLRVWRTGGIHDLDMLVLHTSIDLVAAIPESPSLTANGTGATAKSARYAVMLPCDQFSAALNAAIGLSQDNKISHAKEHMKELVSKELDIVIVLDGQGRMSAWGLQSIGHKRRPPTPTTVQPFHIAHAEGLQLKLPLNTPAVPTAWFQDDKMHMLVHSLASDGAVSWWQGLVETFMSTSAPGADRLLLASSWRGSDPHTWSDQPLDLSRGSAKTMNGDQATRASEITVKAASGPAAVTLSATGRIEVASSRPELLETTQEPLATFETGVEGGVVLAANAEVAAIVSSDRMTLTIIDLRDGIVEQCQSVNSTIRSAQCFTLKARQSFVAIAYGKTVDVLVQSRYEQNSAMMRSWQFIRRISIADLGVDITGLAWRADGSLAIAAGTVLFVAGPEAEVERLEDDVRELVEMPEQAKVVQLSVLAHHLNRPLPAWHPSTLEQLVLHGNGRAAVAIVRKLVATLKFWSPGDDLSPMLDEDPENLLRESESHTTWLDSDIVIELREQLDEKELPSISRMDQRRLGHVVDALLYLRDHVNGLDRNAVWYLFTWKLQLLPHQDTEQQVNGNVQPDEAHSHDHCVIPEMSWREIAMMYHSASQQPLLDILILHYDNKLTWHIAMRLGIMAWLTDREALLQAFEQMAQTAYRSSSPPDPTNAAIYYLALHKKQTLAALWRIATWHREQRSTTNFLKKDFSQPDAQTAAKKNAYALMGKRRFHYAAAFFLLADNPADACNVLAGQCDDVQFAIAVARLYCGDGSTVLQELLADRILPGARKDGDRWLMSWCHSVRLEKKKAAEILVQPLHEVVKTWQRDDPATLLLYSQLRKSPSEHEYDAVLRSMKILGRMGFLLLAMDVSRTWKFAAPSLPRTNGLSNGFHETLPDRTIDAPATEEAKFVEPPSMLDGFTSPEPALDEKAARQAKAAELLAKMKAKKNVSQSKAVERDDNEEKKEKRQPTQFKEPDAHSLLDSFGF